MCACISAPYNDTQINSAQQSISLSGYSLVMGDTVSLRASTSPSGPFVEFATATASGPSFTMQDGTTLYGFSISAVIPTERWSGDLCAGRQTYVRAYSQDGYALPSLDEVAPDGQSPVACISDRIQAGDSTVVAILACDSPDSPNVRLFTAAKRGPTQHVGDVTIADAADQDQWACLQSLTGNLSVPDSSLAVVELPQLTSVTGDVSLVYSRPGIDTEEDTREIHAPVLADITGSLTIASPFPPANSQLVSMNVGLNALTTVGGDLAIDVDASNVTLQGLDGLISVPGHFTLVTGQGDTTMWSFLQSLSSVVGDLHVDIGNTSLGVLPALVSVGGDFEHIDGDILITDNVSDGYHSLASVGGDMTFSGTQVNGPGTFGVFNSLATVGGVLTYSQVTPFDSIDLGVPGLLVGGLTVTDNSALTLFGGGNITVVNDGPVTVTNNASLCAASVDAFAASLAGWNGVLTNSGNTGACP